MLELGLTIAAWRRGWRFRALIAFASVMAVAFLIGAAAELADGTVEHVTPLLLLELASVGVLVTFGEPGAGERSSRGAAHGTPARASRDSGRRRAGRSEVVMRCEAILVPVFLFLALLTPALAAAEQRRTEEKPLVQPSFREHHTWGVFLGTGWTKDDLSRIEALMREGRWNNPFTGQPFDDVKVFAFGQRSPALEAIRVAGDHLQIHVLSSWKELDGLHVDFALCHSNGCPNVLDAHVHGVMRAEHVLALGPDWTSKNFRPGDLKGATLTFFAMASDPIWRIPAPDWARITDDTPGLVFTIPFDRPTEIPQGFLNLFTQGRADPDHYPVIKLNPPAGQHGTVLEPFRAHRLEASYFQALQAWMRTGGEIQDALSRRIRQYEAGLGPDDDRKPGFFPPGGGGGGGAFGGSTSSSTGQGPLPSKPIVDPLGGVSADIKIDAKDFAPEREKEEAEKGETKPRKKP